MEIRLKKFKSQLTVELEGRLDILTSPELEEKLMPALEGIDKLIFDLAELQFISSAGLRVILSALKILDARGGTMTVKNASENIKKVFKLTGFISVIDFK